MSNHKSIIDNIAIEHFFSDVLKNVLPKGRHQSASYFGPAEATVAAEINLDLSDSNEINEDSDYFYTKKYSFIHYTSFFNLLTILKEKKIRLYNLCGMDDKEEFEVSLQNSSKKLSEYEIKEIKKKIFCFSMCETDLESKEESLPLWRNYAQDGHGVGIVLSFNKRYAKDWLHTMLSKVYYDQKHLDKYLKVEALYTEFKNKYKLSISNFDEMFYKYFAFHKSSIYRSEREVRLVYCQGFHLYNEPPVKFDVTRRYKKTTYIELDLEWEMPDQFKKQNFKNIRPIINLDKIILGYRLSNDAKWDLVDVCNTHLKNFKNRPKIEDSSLFKHFNEKK